MQARGVALICPPGHRPAAAPGSQAQPPRLLPTHAHTMCPRVGIVNFSVCVCFNPCGHPPLLLCRLGRCLYLRYGMGGTTCAFGGSVERTRCTASETDAEGQGFNCTTQ